MKMRSVAPMRIAKYGYIVMSIAFCVIGLLVILFPEVSMTVLCRVLGVALLCFGVIKLIGYFSRDLFRLAFQFDLEFGILLLALGLLVLVRPVGAMSVLCVSLGIAVLADGLFKIRVAVEAKDFGVRPWRLLFVLAILTAAAGLLLIFRPQESAAFMTTLLGLSLLTEGILNLCVAISTVKIIRHQQPDVIDAEICDDE